MAAPILGVVRYAARKLYRDSKGRFISKAKYELNQRRDPATGRFLSKQQASNLVDKRKAEAFLTEQLGAAPAGKTWGQIVAKYPDKFADYLDES